MFNISYNLEALDQDDKYLELSYENKKIVVSKITAFENSINAGDIEKCDRLIKDMEDTNIWSKEMTELVNRYTA